MIFRRDIRKWRGRRIFHLSTGKRTEQFKDDAGKISSNITNELHAVQKALNEYLISKKPEETKGLVIFSDSKFALRAIQKGNSGPVQNVQNVLHKIHNLNKKCILQWVPAHVGIDKIETADTLAKEAPIAERVRACPPFRHAHCVEPGIVSLMPLMASWSCPGCICVIKIVLVRCRLMDLRF